MTQNDNTIQVNQIPANTWNWLKMNSAVLSLEEISGKGKEKISAGDLPESVAFIQNAAADDESVKQASGIKTSLGEKAPSLFEEHNACVHVIRAEKNTAAALPVKLSVTGDSPAWNELVIHAKENSTVSVIVEFDVKSVNAFCTKIIAEKGSRVHFSTVQLSKCDGVHINDIGTEIKESAYVEVTQIELGAKKIFTGIRTSLCEYQARLRTDTAYIARNNQEFDMNYEAVSTGKKTDCLMNVKGTITDSAKKTYRGTIDFKNGCSGSTGNEMEETLLLSSSAVNKSIPIILCDEEDVSGEHGASIGKLGEEILFYMNSRGISRSEAEKIMMKAKVMSVASRIGDEAAAEKISEYMEGSL